MKIKVKNLLQYIGGNTKVIIGNCFNTDNKFYEIWRGRIDELDWNSLPCGNEYVKHITVVENEDWLQIWT